MQPQIFKTLFKPLGFNYQTSDLQLRLTSVGESDNVEAVDPCQDSD